MTLPTTPSNKATKPGSLLAPKKPKAMTAKSVSLEEEITVQEEPNAKTKETSNGEETMEGKGKRIPTTKHIKPNESSNDASPNTTTTHENCAKNQHKHREQSHKQIIKASLEMIKKGLEKVNTINSTASIRANKASAIDHLENAARQLEAIIEIDESPESKLTDSRFDNFERELREIKNAIKEQGKTWAQVAEAAPAPTHYHSTANNTACKPNQQQREQLKKEKMKQDMAKSEVTLSVEGTSEETKKALAEMNPKEITERLQQAIDTAITEGIKPKLLGINRLKNNNIRLQVKTEEQAKQLQRVDWSKAFIGLTQHKPKYGMVIHRVPKNEFDLADDEEIIIAELENSNPGTPISSLTSLRRKAPRNPNATHQSIVIFTTDMQEANKCIKSGFYINYTRYPAERYAPQTQITQCYNCYGYGHRANQCKHKQRCGKCSEEDHNTNDCMSKEMKCAMCGGNHPAWHFECTKREEESRKKEDIRKETPAYFTQ